MSEHTADIATKNTYELPKKSLPELDLSHHLSDLIEVRDFIEARGVSAHNTRIARYISYLSGCISSDLVSGEAIFKNSKDERFQSPIDWHMYVLREVHELMWILKGLKAHIPQGIDDKLKLVVSGSDFAALDKNTEHRDTQYELRVASYFCQAGYTVDLSTKTDIIAESEDQVFYVECKRVGSHGGIKSSLSKAKKQIIERMPKKHSGKKTFGIIAMDVTKVVFKKNGITIGYTPDHSRDVIRDGLQKAAGTVGEVNFFSSKRSIVNCWLQIHIPVLSMAPAAPMTRFSSLVLESPLLNSDERSASLKIKNILQQTSDPDFRSDPIRTLRLREGVSFLAGSKFWFNEELLGCFLGGAAHEILNLTPDEIIARLHADEKIYEFSLFEYEMTRATFSEEDQNKIRTEDKALHTALLLISKMYVFRFPYLSDNEI